MTLDFLIDPFREPTGLRALIEISMLGIAGGVVGTWVVLYRFSYAAESLAHGLLPGLVIAALAGFPLLLGGVAGLIVAAFAVALAAQIDEIDRDTAIGVVVTFLLGLGVLLALSPQTPAGLNELLFGDILGTTDGDLLLAAALAVVAVAGTTLLGPRLTVVGFDRTYAASAGVKPVVIDFTVVILIAAVLLVAVQGLGNLLVVAVLVGPPAAARLMTNRVSPMLFLAAATAVIAGFVGLVASYHLQIASGATVTLSFIAAYGLAAASRRRLV